MANYKFTPESKRFKPPSIGTRFGRLTVIGESYLLRRHWKTPCRCDCGRECAPYTFSQKGVPARSCGRCSRLVTEDMKAAISKANRTHGWSGTQEYNAWLAMRKRCLNPKDGAYDRYGGRGITVAADWVNDFPAFLAHIGPKPSPDFSLDRIDNERGYEPGNVRWADRSTQSRNRRAFVLAPAGKQPPFVMVNGIKYVPERPLTE